MNAVRKGDPVAVVASRASPVAASSRPVGKSDSNTGSATQAPTPRRKARRLTPGTWFMAIPDSLGIGHGDGRAPSLEGRRVNDTTYQDRGVSLQRLQLVHQFVHRMRVGGLQSTAEGVDKHL